jgi:hypothetical protein
MTLLSIINDYPWWLSMMITHFIIHYYPLLSNIINYYPLLLIGYTAFFNKRDWSPQLLRHAFCGYCRLCRPTSSKDVQHFLATTLNMKAPSTFNIHQKYVFICVYMYMSYIYIIHNNYDNYHLVGSFSSSHLSFVRPPGAQSSRGPDWFRMKGYGRPRPCHGPDFSLVFKLPRKLYI